MYKGMYLTYVILYIKHIIIFTLYYTHLQFVLNYYYYYTYILNICIVHSKTARLESFFFSYFYKSNAIFSSTRRRFPYTHNIVTQLY